MTEKDWKEFIVKCTERNKRKLQGEIADVLDQELYWFNYGYIIAMHQVRQAITDLQFNALMGIEDD